jgi:hypothetical protein
VRMVETGRKPEANFDALIHHENAISRSVGGRTVFDDKHSRRFVNPRQGTLF